jgi:hypothetical protein
MEVPAASVRLGEWTKMAAMGGPIATIFGERRPAMETGPGSGTTFQPSYFQPQRAAPPLAHGITRFRGLGAGSGT